MVEVVLALSIVALGLLTIMGLFPQALNSAKSAADDSLTSLVAQDTIAERRIEIATNGAPIAVIPNGDIGRLSSTSVQRWFTVSGQETNVAGLGEFHCVLTVFPVTTVPSLPNLEFVQVQVMWPYYNTTVFPPNTNTYYTEISKY